MVSRRLLMEAAPRKGARPYHPRNAVGHRRQGDRVRRREFIAGLGAAVAPLAMWSLVARAQQPSRVRHVGVLMNAVKDDPGGLADVAAFRQGLAELGWVEGRNIHIEFRWPGADIERVGALGKRIGRAEAGRVACPLDAHNRHA